MQAMKLASISGHVCTDFFLFFQMKNLPPKVRKIVLNHPSYLFVGLSIDLLHVGVLIKFLCEIPY